MEIRKSNQKLKMRKKEKSEIELLNEKVDKLNKSIEKLFKTIEKKLVFPVGCTTTVDINNN